MDMDMLVHMNKAFSNHVLIH